MSTFPTQLFATIIALLAVLVLAWLCLKTLSHATRRSRSSYRIKVLESVPVGTRERLVLTKLDDEELLLGVTAESVTVLSKKSANQSQP